MPSLRQTSATAASSRDKSVYIWSIGAKVSPSPSAAGGLVAPLLGMTDLRQDPVSMSAHQHSIDAMFLYMVDYVLGWGVPCDGTYIF